MLSFGWCKTAKVKFSLSQTMYQKCNNCNICIPDDLLAKRYGSSTLFVSYYFSLKIVEDNLRRTEKKKNYLNTEQTRFRSATIVSCSSQQAQVVID